MEFKLTEKMALEIVESLKRSSPIEKELLGEDWIDGYKTGLLDMLIILGIPFDELESIASSSK